MNEPTFDQIEAENAELRKRVVIMERTFALLIAANKIDEKTLQVAKELASL